MKRNIAIIFLLSLAVRLAYFWIAPPRSMSLDDAQSWDNVGWNLVQGKGFTETSSQGEDIPTSIRPPVYPLFLAAIYWTFGHDVRPVKLIQIILSALTSVVIFLIGRIALDETTGFWAGILCSVWPPLIVYSTIIMSETLYTFLLAVTMYFFTVAILKRSSMWHYVGAGIFMGLSNLCRSTFSLYPFFLIIALLIVKNRKTANGT